jgi:hypothetical protein
MSLAFALMAAINGSTGSSATIVPTGILPLRATAHGGSAVDVAPGQVGVVHLAHVGHHGCSKSPPPSTSPAGGGSPSWPGPFPCSSRSATDETVTTGSQSPCKRAGTGSNVSYPGVSVSDQQTRNTPAPPTNANARASVRRVPAWDELQQSAGSSRSLPLRRKSDHARVRHLTAASGATQQSRRTS